MRTYSIRSATTKTTGHYRRPGTRNTYCNKPAGHPNEVFASVKGWKLCKVCVKNLAAAEATTTAQQIADDATADTERAELALTVDTIETAEAAAGTWRGGWITGTPTAPTGDVLFDLGPADQDQGALFV